MSECVCNQLTSFAAEHFTSGYWDLLNKLVVKNISVAVGKILY